MVHYCVYNDYCRPGSSNGGNGVELTCTGIEDSIQSCQMSIVNQCEEFVDLRCEFTIISLPLHCLFIIIIPLIRLVIRLTGMKCMYSVCEFHFCWLFSSGMIDVPPYGSLRLFKGSGPAGSLHLFNGRLFVPMCDHNFGTSELMVACRQLGYETGIQVINNTLWVCIVASYIYIA